MPMKLHQKALLISAMCALPLAAVQASNTDTKQGEVIESPKPSTNPVPPKSPNTGTPAPTSTATGEAPESSKPRLDKPASNADPHANMDKSDVMPSTAPAPGEVGKPNETAPSMESPPGGAPMRTGPDNSMDGKIG